MTKIRCDREDELLECLQRGFTGPELAAHVEKCPSCNELRLVARGVLDERVKAMTEAAVPSASTMWWRLQLRQRLDAQAKARRWLLIGQAMTLVVAIAMIGSFFGADLALRVRDVVASIPLSTPTLLGIATWLLLAPIAGYVAIRQK